MCEGKPLGFAFTLSEAESFAAAAADFVAL